MSCKLNAKKFWTKGTNLLMDQISACKFSKQTQIYPNPRSNSLFVVNRKANLPRLNYDVDCMIQFIKEEKKRIREKEKERASHVR